MEAFQIISIKNNDFTLKNLKTGRVLTHKLYFLGLEEPVTIEHKLAMHEKLFDETYFEYNQQYFIGPINEPYGREITSKENPDFIVLKTPTKQIFLKRFYG